jgi:hypothetical protein
MWYCPGVSETLISARQHRRFPPHVVQDVGHIRFSSKSGFSVRAAPTASGVSSLA